MFGICFVVQYFLSSYFCNHLDGEDIPGCFTLTVCLVTVSVLWPFLTVPKVGQHDEIVVFPDHTHLLF